MVVSPLLPPLPHLPCICPRPHLAPLIRSPLHLPLLMGSPAVCPPPPQQCNPSSPPSSSILPDLPSILKCRIHTIQHVPKGARDLWALTLSNCLSCIISTPDDLSRWTSLFALAKCVLASPASGHRLRWREILKLVKTSLQRWLDGEAADLWAEAVVYGDSIAKRGKKSTSSSSSLNIRRARKATQEGLLLKPLLLKGLLSLAPRY